MRMTRRRQSEAKPSRAAVEAPDSDLQVAELWRYPVKGLRGERLERAQLMADGIPGDRCLRVLDDRGIVTGRRKQRMVGLPATLDDDGQPLVDGHPWRSPEAAAAVREVAGTGAALSAAPGGHEYDAAPILLLGDGSIAQLGYDRRRFRPNIYFKGSEGPVELGWIGGRVRIGEAVLSVDKPDERCVITTIDPDTIEVDLDVLKRVRAELDGNMGAYCSVIEPGWVAVGDPVELV
jgi:uncharacterized protein